MKDVGNAAHLIQPDSKSIDAYITRWLNSTNNFNFTLYAGVSAFCLYTCVYAFRKTFPVAVFEGIYYFGVSYKVLLIIFQAVGYGLSKFIGIKIISELLASKRSSGILLMVIIAGLSWLFFGLVPAPYNIIFLFFNGLPLGMVWGMIFSYLEGRKVTEALGAALSVSFIFSSGLCRSVGAFLLSYANVSEQWMPFVASCIFILPLLFFLYLLDRVPPPTTEDIALRTERKPMNASERKTFLLTFLPGIIFFIFTYVLLTCFRDFRDNFSAEVWLALGTTTSPAIYTQTEVPIAITILISIGLIMLVRNNLHALIINHLVIAAGLIMMGTSTYLFQQGQIDGFLWMILTGTGLYLGYVPFNSIFFDRLMATFKYAGTVGFIMYLADSLGYLGSISILMIKEFSHTRLSWLNVFITSSYLITVIGLITITGSMVYFILRHKQLRGTIANS